MTLHLDAGTPPSDALDRAAEMVVARYPTEPLVTPDDTIVRREVSALVDAVRLAIEGGTPGAMDRPPLDRAHLLRMLRIAVLETWSDDEELSLLRTMKAFEAVESRLLQSDEDPTSVDAVRPFARSLLREVAHALLSPLGSIVMLAETLREDASAPLSEAQQRRLNIIHRAAVSGASISNDLLTLTSPRMHYEGKRRFVVGDAIDAIADLVRPVTEARGSDLVVDQAVTEPRSGPGSAVIQAYLGLALRAALITRDGVLELRIEPSEGDLVSFSLVTRGGAPAENQAENAFTIFRTDSGAEGYTLSPEGLAFTAARETLRMLGSELEVGTAPDDSDAMLVRFTIRLPLAS